MSALGRLGVLLAAAAMAASLTAAATEAAGFTVAPDKPNVVAFEPHEARFVRLLISSSTQEDVPFVVEGG